MDKFIGCMVSLDCGETLGTYQGQVIAIDPNEGSLTIVNPYRNGVPYKSAQVMLRSQDIKHLTIVKTSDEVKELPRIFNRQISLLSTSDNTTSNPNSSIKTSASSPNFVPVEQNSCNAFAAHCETFESAAGSNPLKPKSAHLATAKSFPNNVGNGIFESLVECLRNAQASDVDKISHLPNGRHQNSFVDPNRCFTAPGDDQLFRRKRTSSASEIQQIRRTTTPRKVDRQQQKNNDCFNESEVFDDDFDFEKNLALFDKQAVFEEIEKERGNGCGQNGRTARSEQKYRCDENILQGAKPTYHQIKLTNGSAAVDSSSVEYVTDSGLVIPSISLELRKRLSSLAENSGFTRDRMVEMIGRSSGEMVLQLLGGNSRFDPKNSHQRPLVVVLCGAGPQTAIAINCARHLANRSVKVVLFLSRTFPLSKDIDNELQLFRHTNGKVVTNSIELSASAVDMIITALDDHDSTNNHQEAGYETVVSWANQNRARVLAIDPPICGGAIDANWCLTWGLPLSYSERCGQVYLCDLGVPQKLFKELGIVYRSPFGHKFIIPLHNNT